MFSGYVYLLHFHQPISPDHTTQHYLGWCNDLAARMQKHRCGAGARLTEVAKERGIRFSVVRVWRGSRDLERQLKRRKGSPRLCPLCNKPIGQLPNELSPEEIKNELIPF